MKKYIGLTLGLIAYFVLIFLACSEAPRPDLCKLVAIDQSHLPSEAKDDEDRKRRSEMRMEGIDNNFEILMAELRSDRLRTLQPDTCFEDFIMTTFVHVVQNDAEKILNKEFVDLTKPYRDEEIIPLNFFSLIITAFALFNNEPPCLALKPQVDYAVEQWRTEEYEKKQISASDIAYVQCD